MKKSDILFISLAFALLTSCNKDDETMDPIAVWTLSAPSLSNPADNSSIFLDFNQNAEEFNFEWTGATSSEGYNVNYIFLLALADDTGFEEPIYEELISETELSIVAQDLDEYLEVAGVEGGATAAVLWTVKAVSLDKETIAVPHSVSVTRFEEIEGFDNTLYLIADGNPVGIFELNGTVFFSENYVALQQNVTYMLNTKANGTGDAYGVTVPVGTTVTPNADNVTGSSELTAGGNFTVAGDQMYQLTFDIEGGSATWQYYNMKLFHWDEDGQGWDNRNEYFMTYVHPFKFTVTGDLQFGFHSKFNSPWDVQFGSDMPAELEGTMTNNGGSNFDNITTNGLYEANIEIAPDFSEGTYVFILQ